MKHFDVCLVIVNVREFDESAKTSRRTLFKWLAYLSMGKPVVAPLVHEARRIANLVYLASDPDDYVAAIGRALVKTAALQGQRIQYASQFSFSKTLDAIAAPIARHLRERARDEAAHTPGRALAGWRDPHVSQVRVRLA